MGMGFDVISDGKINIDAIIRSFGEMGLSIELLEDSTDIFTVRALRAWGLLLMASDDYFEMLNMVNNASGTLEAQTAVMMQSFTAQFGRLKEELLALLRTEDAMQAVALMVDAIVESFGKLGPDFVEAIINATKGFTGIIEGGFLENLGGMFELMFNLIPVLKQIFDILSFGDGILIKVVFAMTALRLAAGGVVGSFFTLGLMYREQAISLDQLHIRNMQQKIDLLELRKGYAGEETELQTINLVLRERIALKEIDSMQTDIWVAKLRMVQFAFQGLTQAMSMGISMGAMWAMTTNDMMKVALALMAAMQMLNVVLALNVALKDASFWAKTGVGIAYFAVAAVAFLASMHAFKSEMKEMQSEVADTGMFVGNQRAYDTGGATGPRHRLVYVEPGEQIISKTQGMVGMGGANISISIGDVYAQDGTDFAEKLAATLPMALRNVSYGGGF